jgi:hypothetical protein
MTTNQDTTPLKDAQSDNPYHYDSLIKTFGFENPDEFSAWLKKYSEEKRAEFETERLHNIAIPGSSGKSSSKEHIHQNSFDSFPHGAELFNKLFERRAKQLLLTPEESEQIKEVFDTTNATDEEMVAFGRQWDDFLLKTFDNYAFTHEIREEPSLENIYPAVMEIDFSNMGGANIAIGRKNVNRCVNLITSMYEKALDSVDAKYTKIRRGGDEMRFYITGAEVGKLKEAIDHANHDVQEFEKALGLQNLQHLKDHDKPWRAGFGAGAHVSEVENYSFTPNYRESISKEYDAAIKQSKEVQGRAKGLTQEDLISPADFAKDKTKVHAAEEAIYAAERKYTEHLPSERKANTPRMFTGDTMDAALQQSHGDFYTARERIAETITFSGTTDEQAQKKAFLKSMVALMNTKNPVTGLKSREGLNEALRYFSDKAKAAYKEGELPPDLTLFETTNLAGLNELRDADGALLGHDKVDKVIRAFVESAKEIIKKHLPEDEVDAQLYSFGASRFCLISKGLDENAKKALWDDVCQNTVSNAAKYLPKGITLSDTAKAVSPKRSIEDPETLKVAPEQGVSVISVTTPLIPEWTHDSTRYLDYVENLSDAFARETHKMQAIVTYANPKDIKHTCLIGNTSQPCAVIPVPEKILDHTDRDHPITEVDVATWLKNVRNPDYRVQPSSKIKYNQPLADVAYISKLSQNPTHPAHQK